jgi:hypothetical protein
MLSRCGLLRPCPRAGGRAPRGGGEWGGKPSRAPTRIGRRVDALCPGTFPSDRAGAVAWQWRGSCYRAGLRSVSTGAALDPTPRLSAQHGTLTHAGHAGAGLQIKAAMVDSANESIAALKAEVGDVACGPAPCVLAHLCAAHLSAGQLLPCPPTHPPTTRPLTRSGV